MLPGTHQGVDFQETNKSIHGDLEEARATLIGKVIIEDGAIKKGNLSKTELSGGN